MDGGAPSEVPSPAAPPPDSRARLVNAAVELTLEHYETSSGLRGAFAFLTPGAVAARAGLSRALIYHHWGEPGGADPDAFANFLASVAGEVWQRSSEPDDLTEAARGVPANLSDLIRELCDIELERATGRSRALMRSSAALTLHGLTPEEKSEEVIGQLSEMYEVLGAMAGREPVPPLTWADVAMAISAVFEGHALTANTLERRVLERFDWMPEEPEIDEGRGWTLLAITVDSMLRTMLRPVETDD